MSTKELLAINLRNLAGLGQAFHDVMWRETNVGNDVVNLHTQTEREIQRMFVQALQKIANGALIAASNTADPEEEDGLEIPD